MIQSILFDKRKGWNARSASIWILQHHFDLNKIDDTENFVRVRQAIPWPNAEFRTIKLGSKTHDSGIEFIMMFKHG